MVVHNRISLVADILMFILGVFTLLFVNAAVGWILIILSVFLFGLYLWLMRRFAGLKTEMES